jgi:L-cysteate sulfo-lyase
LDLLGHATPLPRDRVVADDGYIGAGYGQPTDGMREAVQMVARQEGILIDPVYTGKGMAGLIAKLRAGFFAADEDVIFVHTGGATALFGYRWAFDAAAA